MNFSAIRELFGPSGTCSQLPSFIIWVSDQESLVTPCLFTFPETPEKQHSYECYKRLCDVFYHHSSETQVKEFKPLIEMSSPSTTPCRQKWACSGPGRWVGVAAPQGLILPDASSSWGFCIKSCRIYLKKGQLLPILAKKKKNKKKRYRSVALPCPSKASCTSQCHQDFLNIQQFWKSRHLP